MEKALLYEFAMAGEVLGGLGRSTIYELVDAGELRRVKVGRRAFITAESVAAYVDRLAGAEVTIAPGARPLQYAGGASL